MPSAKNTSEGLRRNGRYDGKGNRKKVDFKPMSNHKSLPTVIGAPVLRADGPDKAAGRTIYAADVKFPGMLWGKVLRSPHAHARIARIDAAKARRMPGVIAVIN